VKPQRIFYVYFHDTDFVPIHVAEVVNAMVAKGLEVDLFAYRNVKQPLAAALQTGRLRVHQIWTPRVRFVSELIFVTMLFPVLLWQAVRRRPAALYARHGGVSIAVSLVARLTALPCLIEINDIPFDKLVGASGIKILWVRLYHRLALPQARWLLPVTPQIADWLKATYRIKSNKICVIPNGVNIQRFVPQERDAARKKYAIPPNARVLVCLGSLFPWAGIETLIEATTAIRMRHPDLYVAIGSGEEPYLSKIKSLVHERGLEAYYGFFCFIAWEEAALFISTADLCVASFILKNTRSGLCSLRVLAYLACGRAVVGSDITGLGDVLERECIGASCAMGDAVQLAQKVNMLLDDPQELVQMGLRGRDYVVRRHGWESIVRQITACIEQGKK
jgi:glycosyltransferase involved in cell wall biosynthesis